MRSKIPRQPDIPAKYIRYPPQDWPGGWSEWVQERESYNASQPPVRIAGSTPGGFSLGLLGRGAGRHRRLDGGPAGSEDDRAQGRAVTQSKPVWRGDPHRPRGGRRTARALVEGQEHDRAGGLWAGTPMAPGATGTPTALPPGRSMPRTGASTDLTVFSGHPPGRPRKRLDWVSQRLLRSRGPGANPMRQARWQLRNSLLVLVPHRRTRQCAVMARSLIMRCSWSSPRAG